MKILHTSDWHLGKKLNGRSRLFEQAEILNELCELAERESVDLVLLAGDVFDSSVPSAEAEELFYKTAFRLAGEKRALVIISGNHDDRQRLSACRDLAALRNVYVFGGEAPSAGDKTNLTYAQKTGKSYCVISSRGEKERVYIGLLPYPTDFRDGAKELTFEQKMRERIDDCFAYNAEGLPQIFAAHIFMLGGTAGESERDIELGGTRLVDKSLVPENCLYTALGHLHKRQVISRERNILYSGAIAGYAFDEVGVQKSVTVFELNFCGRGEGCGGGSCVNGGDCENGVTVENLRVIPLEKGKKLVSLVACDVNSAKQLLESYGDCLIKLTLKLNHPLSEKESKELAGDYPALCELNLQISSAEYEKTVDRRALSATEAFIEYHKSKYGAEPSAELLNLYLELMGDDDNETA